MAAEKIEDIGTVTAVSGNRITVEINKGEGCKSCGIKGLCGNSMKPVVLQFETKDKYRIGDKVKVSIPGGIRVLSSLLIFGVPLMALFGFFLLARVFVSEIAAVVIGFAGLSLAFLLIRCLDRSIGKYINFQLEGMYEDLPE